MFSPSIALAGLALLAPPDLAHPRQTTSPTSGVLAALTEDGQTLWQARGPFLVAVDLDRVRRWELAGVEEPKLERATGRPIQIGTSITSLLDVSGTLYVGGGDSGLFRVSPQGEVSLVEAETGGRWCFDLAVDEHRRELYAVWGARDESQLRTYDLETGRRTRTVDLTVSAGLRRAGIAYALALHGDAVFLAVGRAGLARVRWDGGQASVEPGPDLVPAGTGLRAEDLAPWRVRDLAVSEGWLVAAAEGSGVVEVDLDGVEWGSEESVRRHALPGNYPLRVETLEDPETGRSLVAVGTAPTPSAAHEWGPYVQYGAFDWKLGPYGVEPGSYAQGCDTALFVFERRDSGELVQALWAPTDGGPAERSWKSLSLQHANGRYWVYDNEFTVWSFWRTEGGWSGIRRCEDRKYSAVNVSYTAGIVSKLDPTLVLCASDAGRRLPHYRVAGTPGRPRLDPIDGTEDRKFQLGLMLNGSWISPRTGHEWFGFGTRGDYWKLVEFVSSMQRPELLTNPFGTWTHYFLPYPPDPQYPELTGRSYSVVAVDDRPGSELVAMARTQTPTPVTLYHRSAIERAAWELRQAGKHTGYGNPLQVAPAGHLAIHPELEAPYSQSELARIHTLDMHLFTWHEGGARGPERRVLGIAAGANPSTRPGEPRPNHPKLVFVDVTDCAVPGSPCSAVLAGPGLGPDPATQTIAYGSRPDALLWDFTVATIEGRQLAFACDTSGSVLVFDLTELFRGEPLTEIARWQLPPSPLDGSTPPLSAIRYRREGEEDVLWIAANRRGVVKLRVAAAEGGALRLEHVETRNTPSQAAGLLFGSFPLGGPEATDAMLVFDHEDGGIELYTE